MNPTFTVELDCKQLSSRQTAPQWLKKATLEIIVFCPQPSCGDAQVVQIRNEESTGNPRSMYRCCRCGHEFRPETSLAGQMTFEHEVQYVLDQRYGANASQEHLAAELAVDQATMRRLEQRLGENATRLAPLLNEPPSANVASPSTEEPLTNKIPLHFIDVTWKSVQGEDINIVQVVNERGERQAVTFPLKRDVSAMQEALRLAMRHRGPAEIIIADGCPTTAQAVDHLKLPGLLVQHIHKPPYGRMTLTLWTFSRTCDCQVAWTIGLDNSFPIKGGERWGCWHFSVHRCDKHACLCDPTLCLNGSHHPLCLPCQTSPDLIRLGQRWRTCQPHAVWHTGCSFRYEQYGAFQPPVLPPSLTWILPEQVRVWALDVLQTAVIQVWQAFRGKHVTSNPVENAHSDLHQHLRWRGRNTLKTARYRLLLSFIVRHARHLIPLLIRSLPLLLFRHWFYPGLLRILRVATVTGSSATGGG